ncbi:MAG: hypothetical protein IJT43_10155 [Stomatobaculum sp.]|nr:hypothetical protein [Stomatobaculum sp.]
MFYRLDLGTVKDKGESPGNDRFLTEGKYKLKHLDEKYQLSSFEPSLEGMDQLHISGSAQYSEKQFRNLANTLRECAGGDPVYIIDLREESHAFVDGKPVSIYGTQNAANKGKTLEQILEDEQARFASLPGTELKAYRLKGDGKGKKYTVNVKTWMTERELAESEGFNYLRIPATDHIWPAPEKIDTFIEFARGLDMDHVWLHFHCHAGRGRTGAFMVIYDIMKNPDVPLEDIVARQAMTGSTYLLYTGGSGKDKERHEEKARMVRLVYQYIRENKETNYETPWSEWLQGVSLSLFRSSGQQLRREPGTASRS